MTGLNSGDHGAIRFRRWGALMLALLTFLVLALLWGQARHWYQAQALARLQGEERAEAAIEVTLQGNVLSSLLERRFARLQALVAFAETVPENDSFGRQFAQFAAALYADSRGVRNFTLAPAAEVRYIYPLAGNESLTGYRPLDDPRPEIRADARRALRTGALVLSGPLEQHQGNLALVARAPIYRDDAVWGLANMELDLPILLAEAGLAEPAGTLTYALRNGGGTVFWGDPAVFNQDPVRNQVALPDGAWELGGVPTSGWGTAALPDRTLLQVAGWLLAFLLAALVYLMLNRQDQLRVAVAARTAELAESNQRLEERVAERTQELERLHREAASLAVLRERQRLARELHDSVAQALYGIALGARTARTLLERGKTAEVGDPLHYIHELAEGATAEMRALIFELRPETLEREGLATVLERQAEAVRARHRLQVATDLCTEPEAPLPVKEALYRVTQEALNNVVKHAGATRIALEMSCRPNMLSVTIRDDGAGFDPDRPHPGHLGLQTMRERVEQLGGEFYLNSAPGKGTTVEAQIPLN